MTAHQDARPHAHSFSLSHSLSHYYVPTLLYSFIFPFSDTHIYSTSPDCQFFIQSSYWQFQASDIFVSTHSVFLLAIPERCLFSSLCVSSGNQCWPSSVRAFHFFFESDYASGSCVDVQSPIRQNFRSGPTVGPDPHRRATSALSPPAAACSSTSRAAGRRRSRSRVS